MTKLGTFDTMMVLGMTKLSTKTTMISRGVTNVFAHVAVVVCFAAD